MLKRTVHLVIALLIFCGFAHLSTASAQTQTGSAPGAPSATQQQTTPSSTGASLDLEITANVTARELRFETVPNPTVEFTGKPKRNTVWDAERENLPRPVEPGVTYRNIGIRLKITSAFADIERIVAEALGEVPVTDDTPQEKGNTTETEKSTTATEKNTTPANQTPSPGTTTQSKEGTP